MLFAEISEDEAEDRLQDAIQEKFAVFGDVCASGELYHVPVCHILLSIIILLFSFLCKGEKIKLTFAI